MNDQSTPPVSSMTGQEPATVYLSKHMLSKLAEASLAVPNCIPVMLMLVSEAKADGSIELSSLEVAQQCELTLKKFTAAVFGLAGAGLLEDLNVRASLEGRLLCQVSPSLVRSEAQKQK